MIKKRIIAILFAFGLAVSAPLSIVCADSVSAADEIATQEDIDRFTRYPIFNNSDLIQDITDMVDFFYGSPVDDIRDIITRIRDSQYQAPVSTSLDVYKKLVDYANASTDKNYIIRDSACFMAKRFIKYPYNSWQETDYLIVYVDSNDSLFDSQQFGDFTITPNSILLIRQTNFMGVKVTSIPMSLNKIKLVYDVDGYACALSLDNPPNDEYTFDTPEGPVVHDFETSFSNPTVSNCRILFANNSSNTIVDDWLIDRYSSDYAEYIRYIPDNTWLDDLEVFLGNGYNWDYSDYTIGGRFLTRPWYFSYAFFNNGDSDPTYLTKNFNNNITNTINPKNPPAYIVPSDSPFKSGKIINNTTVKNYNDYGITYDSVSNEFELDIDALAAALGAAITPDFTGVFDGTFESQPKIGADFSASPSLDLDYNKEIFEYVNSLLPAVPAESWEPPTYESVNTEPLVSYTYPVLPTETVPQSVLDDVGMVTKVGFDVFGTLGTSAIGILVSLAVLGAVSYFIWG